MSDDAYTEDQYQEFTSLVRDNESQSQVRRIHGRLGLRRMVNEIGKDVCDKMFARLCEEEGHGA